MIDKTDTERKIKMRASMIPMVVEKTGSGERAYDI